jgi:CRISPR-associated protein Csb2
MDPEGQRFRAFRLTQAAKVAAILRHAVAAVVKQTGHAEPGVDPNDWLNLYVHGHARTNDTKLGRFAYLPLPSIRPQDVVGDIRRALIVEPLDGLGQHAGWASRMVPGRNLVNEETKKPEALLVHASAKDYVIDRYVAPAREWVTVTPVVLPWGDSGKPHRAVKQFFKALRHAAYRPEDVEVEPQWLSTISFPAI